MTNKQIQRLFEKKRSLNRFNDWVKLNVCTKKEMDFFVKWLNQIDESEILKYIKEDDTILSAITNQTDFLIKHSIEESIFSIRFVKDQTIDLCIFVLKKDEEFESKYKFYIKNIYQYIRIVPNPDHKTTLKNLLEKKAILEALK